MENSEALIIKTIKQEICKPEEKEQQIKLDEKQEKNPYETLLIWDIKEEELKPGHMKLEKLSMLRDVVKYDNIFNTPFVIMNKKLKHQK